MSSLYPHIQRLWKPYLGTSCAVAASMFIGDYVCQRLELQQKHDTSHTNSQHILKQSIIYNQSDHTNTLAKYLRLDEIDLQRSYAMVMTGFFVSSIFGHTQQRIMEYYIPGNSMKSIASKMTINCVVAPVNIALSFTSIIYFRNGTSEQIKHKLQNDITSTWLAGIIFWPAVSFVNFRYIQLNYRAGLGSFFGAVWNIYISRQANKTDQNQVQVVDTPPLAAT